MCVCMLVKDCWLSNWSFYYVFHRGHFLEVKILLNWPLQAFSKFSIGYVFNRIHLLQLKISLKLLNWSLQALSNDYHLASPTTHFVYVNFIYEWQHLQFNMDSERQFLFNNLKFCINRIELIQCHSQRFREAIQYNWGQQRRQQLISFIDS